MQVPYSEQIDLGKLIGTSVSFAWKEWPMDMEAINGVMNEGFSFRGTCPHSNCRHKSVFTMVTASAIHQLQPDTDPQLLQKVAVLQCSGCLGYILGIVKVHHTKNDIEYIGHYPLGTPDDSVPEDIPNDIAEDFKEALRCDFVKAHNATVEMCRRALENSCLHLGADEKLGTVQKMIDWVHGQGLITKPLCDMAHKIRLGGDRGAHPSKSSAAKKIGPDEAAAVIEFTREYFDHVYVMPARMAKFDFSRPKPEKKDGTV